MPKTAKASKTTTTEFDSAPEEESPVVANAAAEKPKKRGRKPKSATEVTESTETKPAKKTTKAKKEKAEKVVKEKATKKEKVVKEKVAEKKPTKTKATKKTESKKRQLDESDDDEAVDAVVAAATGEKVKKPRKKRAKKDPNLPKLPLSAYLRFSASVRESIQEKNPGIKITEISKETGRLWKELDEASKQPYLDAYQKDKADYDVRRDEYLKSQIDPDKPIAPAKSGYLLFSNEKRPSVAGTLTNEDCMKKLASMWRALDESEKAKYNQAYEKARDAYKIELEEYKRNKGLTA